MDGLGDKTLENEGRDRAIADFKAGKPLNNPYCTSSMQHYGYELEKEYIEHVNPIILAAKYPDPPGYDD